MKKTMPMSSLAGAALPCRRTRRRLLRAGRVHAIAFTGLIAGATACGSDTPTLGRPAPGAPPTVDRYEHAVAYQIITKSGSDETTADRYVPQMGASARKRSAALGLTPLAAEGEGDEIEPQVYDDLEANAGDQSLDIVRSLLNVCAAESGSHPVIWSEVLDLSKRLDVPPYYASSARHIGDEFIFARATSCDTRLARQESLLCVAQHLHDLANAVGVTEYVEPLAPESVESRPRKLRFQPQRPSDRFILRDLSLVVLAEMAKMDANIVALDPVTEEFYGVNCDYAYRMPNAFSSADVWGADFYDLNPNTSEEHTLANTPRVGWGLNYADSSPGEMGGLRLSHRMQILKAAARLTHTLVEETTRADAELAERAAANAADPRTAAGLRWGFRQPVSKVEGPFVGAHGYDPWTDGPAAGQRTIANNYPHTATILYGRLERFGQPADSGYWGEAQCDGDRVAEAADTFYSTARTYAVARGRGSPISSPGAAKAFSLFREAGFAPQPNLNSEEGQRDELKSILVARRAAGSSGMAFDAVGKLVDGISSADFNQGMEFAYNHAEQLFPGEGTRPGVFGLGGGSFRFPGTLPMTDGSVSLDAALIETRFAALCTPGANLSTSQGVAMQGAIGLGASLSRQATAIAHHMGGEHLAAAEVRSLVGGSWYSAVVTGGDLTVYGFNIRPEDVGLDSLGNYGDVAHLDGRLALVWGPGWLAQCAAGLRTFCPEEDLQDRVVVAETTNLDTVTGWTGEGTGANELVPGAHELALTLTFSGASPTLVNADAFDAARDEFSEGERNRLILVRLPDRQHAGSVIGPLRPSDSLMTAPVTLVSALGSSLRARTEPAVGKSILAGSCGVDKQCSADAPTASCIVTPDGRAVERDSSVPLENELTSNSDSYENSWRHYLDQAKAAALHADELGREIIQNGLAQDTRKEVAQEELAGICGKYALAEAKTSAQGEVVPADGDPTIDTCRGGTIYNTVYLGECPPIGLDPSCNMTRGQAAVNGRRTLGLGIVPAPADDSNGDQCSMFDAVFGGEAAYQTELVAAFASPAVSSAAIRQKNGSLAFYDDPPESRAYIPWHVSLGADRIMDTEDPERWPKCRETTCTSELNVRLEKAFGYPNGLLPADYTELRWRVQGAMWTLARAAGNLRSGFFNVYVPMRNGSVDPGDTSEIVTVYNGGVGSEGWEGPQSMDTEFIEKAYNGAIALPSGFRGPGAGGASWLPGTSDGGRFVMVRTSNVGATPEGWDRVGGWTEALSAISPLLEPGNLDATRPSLRDAGEEPVKKMFWSGMSLCGSPGGMHRNDNPLKDAWIRGQKLVPNGTYMWFSGEDVEFFDALIGPGANHAQTAIPNYGLPGESNTFSHAWARSWTDDIYARPRILGADGACPSLDPLDAFCPYRPLNASSIVETELGSPIPRRKVLKAAPIGLHSEFELRDLPALTSWSYVPGRLLAPRGCSPQNRVPAMIASVPPTTYRGIARQLAGAYLLACTGASRKVGVNLSDFPVVHSYNDITYFQSWAATLSKEIHTGSARISIDDVPDSVVGDVLSGVTSNADKAGQVGLARVDAVNGLIEIKAAWLQLSQNVSRLAAEVGSVEIAIRGAGIAADTKAGQLAIQQLDVTARICTTLAAAVKTLGTFLELDPQKVASKATTVMATTWEFEAAALLTAELAILDDLKALSEAERQNNIDGIMDDFRKRTSDIYTDIGKSVLSIQSSTGKTIAAMSTLKSLRGKVDYELAKASNDNFFVQDGQYVPIPVNTVLSRQRSAAEKRYRLALTNAKYLAHLARVAIEQRLAVRLDTLTEPLGPLAAPHDWVDDICTMEGIDYKKIRSAQPPVSKPSTPDQPQFPGQGNLYEHLVTLDDGYDLSEQFIGDYVAKLEAFVEYYNVKQPSSDSDDQLVLSLRDDLLSPVGLCTRPAANLLLQSENVGRAVAVGDDGKIAGWQSGPCSASKCLILEPAAGLTQGAVVPEGAGSAMWLHEIEGEPGANTQSALQPRSVSQTVRLLQGSYVFSFWNQHRQSDGAIVDSYPMTAPRFEVQVRGSGGPLAFEAADGGWGLDTEDVARWSSRRKVRFTIGAEQDVTIVLRAAEGDTGLGSYLVAGVQLEKVASEAAEPGPYQGTGDSRLVSTGFCTGNTSEAMRSAFSYVCRADGCAYELSAPISADTTERAFDANGFARRLSKGNHNYRHGSLAVNLVGTGVIDCALEPGSACYANSVVDYSIEHDARDVYVTAWSGKRAGFDFGIATINRGRGVAAERLMTTPVGSADQSLLSQLGVEKAEFRGRPIDGTYRLRVWDRPGLAWSRVEDVQLVLKYHSWSANGAKKADQ